MKMVKFGGTAAEQDELAALVLNNIKTATSSLVALKTKETSTRKGDCWQIVDSRTQPICVVKVTHVVISPFGDIDLDFALKEGDGSFANWRQIHQVYYAYLLEKVGTTLTEDTLLECVYFEKML